jgi:hypothetical protein
MSASIATLLASRKRPLFVPSAWRNRPDGVSLQATAQTCFAGAAAATLGC